MLGTPIAALAGSMAACLITGDKDLLALADRYPIVSPGRFRERYGA